MLRRRQVKTRCNMGAVADQSAGGIGDANAVPVAKLEIIIR
ncbi:hypothetical protein RLPCCGM1_p0879 [Rhizobium leguminosarum bv. phaseoli CCGM1]|nr:hypothetical protein RLPCCGM1_p0879 [Rhizobium leguminosarum bv. phaseoli CCGM1]